VSIDVQREGRVALVTINRPDVLNALSSALLEELLSELDVLARDASVGAVVLTGAGDRAFIAGADIGEMATKTPLEARAYAELGQEVAHRSRRCARATLAAVNGYALGGGCEMALACDIRYCSASAAFGQPEINLGIMPGWGATQRLARTTSLGFAKEMILTGRMVKADEAFTRGLVQAVHPAETLVAATLETARTIAAKSPLAAAYAKEATNRALHGDLGANFVHEADLFAILLSSEDAKEGLSAFTEKREPCSSAADRLAEQANPRSQATRLIEGFRERSVDDGTGPRMGRGVRADDVTVRHRQPASRGTQLCST
jgi:enoyl-CoA hydratase